MGITITWHGRAWLGKARHGRARQGVARQGVAWQGIFNMSQEIILKFLEKHPNKYYDAKYICWRLKCNGSCLSRCLCRLASGKHPFIKRILVRNKKCNRITYEYRAFKKGEKITQNPTLLNKVEM